ncbi:hypothetical protein H6G41_08085 [Tolypothrix sp. FACHB-123]|uniref:hypothetical protein n=1 Tax=Tolypothrix sp. FACHB-123 TaxID=2692868 RepID=UPI001688FBD4|nr:hypothetical protein [Tolypothrix sp. FACHB-123]MBD2354588.1 hypothetical protein [Tolypothrix sp. FACHB-123]
MVLNRLWISMALSWWVIITRQLRLTVFYRLNTEKVFFSKCLAQLMIVSLGDRGDYIRL